MDKVELLRKLKNIIMSKLIQKHFGKIAAGTGLGIAGAAQYFPKLGE